MTRIYLDNAATSWPKPEAVYTVVDDYQRNIGAPGGRSGYAEAAHVSREIESARRCVARLLGSRHSGQLVFAFNGTDALNLALHGLLRQGDHVVTSVAEHNSVLRPLSTLAHSGVVSVTYVNCDACGWIDPADLRAALRPNTRLIALVHASNVTGTLQPIEAAGEIAREAGVLLLVDASQTVGYVPMEADDLPIDLLATSGHKGLLGPLGTGLLYIRQGIEEQLASVRQGGTGTFSEEDWQPSVLPSKYESGNLNVPGILGLGAAAEYLYERGLAGIRKHSEELTGILLEGLTRVPGVRIHGPRHPERQVGLVSITVEGYDPQEVAAMLDATFHVQTRPGLHCSPRMHRALGTASTGGTVRFSLGFTTSREQIEAAVAAVGEIAATAAQRVSG
jgi:cysteine desulfurase family protein